MYITAKNIETIRELQAFVDGALENVEDEEYWQSLSERTTEIFMKMKKQREKQEKNKNNRKALAILKKINK